MLAEPGTDIPLHLYETQTTSGVRARPRAPRPSSATSPPSARAWTRSRASTRTCWASAGRTPSATSSSSCAATPTTTRRTSWRARSSPGCTTSPTRCAISTTYRPRSITWRATSTACTGARAARPGAQHLHLPPRPRRQHHRAVHPARPDDRRGQRLLRAAPWHQDSPQVPKTWEVDIATANSWGPILPEIPTTESAPHDVKEHEMIFSEMQLPANPAGATPLDRSQIWKGLEQKAVNAVPYVEAITDCREINRLSDTVFDREIELGGARYVERVWLDRSQPRRLHPDRRPVLGTITNEILEEDGELGLRFQFALVIAPGRRTCRSPRTSWPGQMRRPTWPPSKRPWPPCASGSWSRSDEHRATPVEAPIWLTSLLRQGRRARHRGRRWRLLPRRDDAVRLRRDDARPRRDPGRPDLALHPLPPYRHEFRNVWAAGSRCWSKRTSPTGRRRTRCRRTRR